MNINRMIILKVNVLVQRVGQIVQQEFFYDNEFFD